MKIVTVFDTVEEPSRPPLKSEFVLQDWAECLEAAEEFFFTHATASELAEWTNNEEWKIEMRRGIAENMMVARACVPPNWKRIVRCKSCGFVPVESSHSDIVQGCPWCHMEASKKQYE